jgi:hypothetical protein
MGSFFFSNKGGFCLNGPARECFVSLVKRGIESVEQLSKRNCPIKKPPLKVAY